jgi:type IV pilus assembly protein PilF
MKIRFLITPAMAALFTACSSLPPAEENYRPNDPYSELSASQVYIEKGVRYMENGHYGVALQDLKRAVELDSGNSEAYNALGVLYQRLDDSANAEASFKSALSLKPDNFAARNNYGRLLCSRARYAEAFDQYHKVIGNKLYGQPWIPLTNAGICAHSAGKTVDAEHYLRDALEIQPGFPPALLEMARLSQETRQYMTARAFLQRYFSAAGPSPEAVQLGIDIENSLGNPQAAAEYAQTLRNLRGRPSGGSPAKRGASR